MQKQYKLLETITLLNSNGVNKVPYTPTRIPAPYKLIHGLNLTFRGRHAIGTAVATAVAAEAPQNWADRIVVRGQRKKGADVVIFDADSAFLHRYNHFLNGSVPTVSSTPALGTAVASYDVEANVYLPFIALGANKVAPWKIPRGFPGYDPDPTKGIIMFPEWVFTLMDSVRYNNGIYLEVTVGNGMTFAYGGAGTRTWTAYGSGAGNPTLDIEVCSINLGPYRDAIRPSLVKRVKKSLNTGVAVNGGVDAKLFDLPDGNFISRIFTRCGVVTAAGATSANPAFDTLNDNLTKPRVKIDDTAISEEITRQAQARLKNAYSLEAFPSGWWMHDYVEDGSIWDALNTQTFPARNTRLELTGDVTALANQQIDVITEEIIPAQKLAA
jgi:hypothetical protein